MVRRASLALFVTALLIVAFGRASQTSAPIKLARHPDYHAGKIAFSYLGDIWTANEDGSAPQRLTDHRAREMYPRFSPDGKWIAFSSNRYGNNDVFVDPGRRRRAEAADLPHRQRRSRRLDARLAAGAVPRRARRRRVSQRRDAVRSAGRRRAGTAAAGRLGLLGQLLAGRQVARLQSPSGGLDAPALSRQLRRRPVDCRSRGEDLHASCCADERYNRYWPMWGADGAIYFVADPLPNDKSVVPGSPDVRKSVNNIYKIPASGGQPVQVTRHVDGNLFWPSMSSDGKVIVYEETFGIWKLDVATGKTSEIRIDIAADEKDNETDVESVNDEVDSFDISPSGRRAVISARGQIFTIATERGDITRVAPDNHGVAQPVPEVVARRQVRRLHVRQVRPRRDLDQRSRGPQPEEDHRSRQREGRDRLDARLEGAALHGGRQEALQLRRRRRQDDAVTSSDVNRIGSVAVSPDSKWVAFAKQDRTLRSHVYIAPIGGGEERHVSDDGLLYAESNAVWTADGRYLVFTSAEGFSNGIATQGGISTTMALWALSLRDQERDPMNRDIDNEAQGLAAEAAARQASGAAAAAPRGDAAPPDVRIDWNGLARRARRITVPGTTIGALTPAPEGHVVALDDLDRRRRRRRGGAPATPAAASTSSTSRAVS